MSSDKELVPGFFQRVLGPVANELGQLLSDHVRAYRTKNLLSISEKFDRICDERGIRYTEIVPLALSIGLPLLNKASYQDDDYLQERWAHLIASEVDPEGNHIDGFSLDISYVEIMHQMSKLDCEVLEFVVENGIQGRKDGYTIPAPLHPETIRDAFPGAPWHISLEKLTSLGCVMDDILLPLRKGLFYPLKSIIRPTIIGINFYITSSGKQLGLK
ncbi:MAG: Abi-alpha family protein [Candidatus Aminicenantes bacterium]|nr:Abi-alpha family protein [Candidatus Aminicenantes bacterium]